MSETYREVITLYYLGDMDSVEIAKFLGTYPVNIRQRLSRPTVIVPKVLSAIKEFDPLMDR